MGLTLSQPNHPLHYTALGDSITVGIGSDLFNPGFVGRYANDAARTLQAPVYTKNFARSGATSGEIFGSLYIPVICDSLQRSDIVTLTAGGNDLIDAAQIYFMDQDEQKLFFALEKAMNNIKAMIERIHFLHNPDHHRYLMRMLNLYNPFPSIPQADLWIHRFNSHLNEYAHYPHIGIADIHSAFLGREQELLNGIHPNDRGYEVIANVLHQLGYAPLK
ncbi:MAG: GDSL-type esterase/lipase family protein [Tuberibacillus sp.]